MAGLSVAESMTIATGLTAVRVAVDRAAGGLVIGDEPEGGQVTVAQAGGEVAKIVTAGALVTLGLLVVERGAPELARGLAVVVLVTSALVHGVRLAEIAITATR